MFCPGRSCCRSLGNDDEIDLPSVLLCPNCPSRPSQILNTMKGPPGLQALIPRTYHSSNIQRHQTHTHPTMVNGQVIIFSAHLCLRGLPRGICIPVTIHNRFVHIDLRYTHCHNISPCPPPPLFPHRFVPIDKRKLTGNWMSRFRLVGLVRIDTRYCIMMTHEH